MSHILSNLLEEIWHFIVNILNYNSSQLPHNFTHPFSFILVKSTEGYSVLSVSLFVPLFSQSASTFCTLSKWRFESAVVIHFRSLSLFHVWLSCRIISFLFISLRLFRRLELFLFFSFILRIVWWIIWERTSIFFMSKFLDRLLNCCGLLLYNLMSIFILFWLSTLISNFFFLFLIFLNAFLLRLFPFYFDIFLCSFYFILSFICSSLLFLQVLLSSSCLFLVNLYIFVFIFF